MCADDACGGVNCPAGEACVEGACVADTCSMLSCDENQVCVNGQCIFDGCDGITCPPGQECSYHPSGAQCVNPWVEDQTRTFNNMPPMNPSEPPREADPVIPEMDDPVIEMPTGENNNNSADSAEGVGCKQNHNAVSSSYTLFLLIGLFMIRRSRLPQKSSTK